MENIWDTVLEQLSSQLPAFNSINDLESPSADSAAFLNGGEHGWLDEKMDLSIWADYILPDDPLAMVGGSPLLDPLDVQDVVPFPQKVNEPVVLNSDFLAPPPSSPPFSTVPESFDNFSSHELDFNMLVDGQPNTVNSLAPVMSPGAPLSESEKSQPSPSPLQDVPLLDYDVLLQLNNLSAQSSPVSSPAIALLNEMQKPPTEAVMLQGVPASPVSAEFEVVTTIGPEIEVVELPATFQFYEGDSCSVPEGSLAETSSDYTSSGSASDNDDRLYKPGNQKNGKPYRPRTKRADAGNRRERKRLQNKDAATRYRIKKRLEGQKTSDEEKILSDENRELKSQVDRLSSEISYLKGLMRELFKAKGLLK